MRSKNPSRIKPCAVDSSRYQDVKTGVRVRFQLCFPFCFVWVGFLSYRLSNFSSGFKQLPLPQPRGQTLVFTASQSPYYHLHLAHCPCHHLSVIPSRVTASASRLHWPVTNVCCGSASHRHTTVSDIYPPCLFPSFPPPQRGPCRDWFLDTNTSDSICTVSMQSHLRET